MADAGIDVDEVIRPLVRNLQFLGRNGALAGVAEIINARALRVSGSLGDPRPDEWVGAAAYSARSGDPGQLAAVGALLAAEIDRLRSPGEVTG